MKTRCVWWKFGSDFRILCQSSTDACKAKNEKWINRIQWKARAAPVGVDGAEIFPEEGDETELSIALHKTSSCSSIGQWSVSTIAVTPRK